MVLHSIFTGNLDTLTKFHKFYLFLSFIFVGIIPQTGVDWTAWGDLDGVSTTDLDGEVICPEARILINGNPNNPLKATQLLGS